MSSPVPPTEREEELLSQIRAKNDQLRSLQASYNEFIDSSKELESELESALSDAQAKIADLNRRKSAIEDKYADTNTQLTSCKSEYAKLQVEYNRLKARVAELEAAKVALEQRNEELSEKLRITSQSEEDASDNLAHCEEEKVLLMMEIEGLRAEKQETETRLRRELTDLQAELSRAASHTEERDEAQMLSMQALEKEVEELRIKLEEAEQQNEALNEELEQMQDEMMQLSSSAENASSSALQDLKSKWDDAETRASQLGNDIDMLTEQMIAKAELLRQQEEETQRLTELEKQHAEELQSVTSDLISAEETVALLRNQLHSKYDEVSQLELRIADLQVEAENTANIQARDASAWKEEKQNLDLRIEQLTAEISDQQAKLKLMMDAAAAATTAATALASNGTGRAFDGMSEEESPAVLDTSDAEIQVDDECLSPSKDLNKSNATLLLDRGGSVHRAIHAAIASGSIEAMRTELLHQLSRYESMRSHNAQLLQRLQAAKGNIQVCCRLRPMNEQEISNRWKTCVSDVDENELACYERRTGTWKSFYFDRVWGASVCQEDVFADIEPFALSVVEGYNACIIAYGQTGSGKTYTMNGFGEDYGVSYRTLSKIFELLQLKKAQSDGILKRRDAAKRRSLTQELEAQRAEAEQVDDGVSEMSEDDDGQSKNRHSQQRKQPEHGAVSDDDATIDNESAYSYTVEVSMLEIYNEAVKDLLNPQIVQQSYHSNAPGVVPSLDIRQTPEGEIVVPGLTRILVKDLEDVMAVFAEGSNNRATASTNLNEHSSRSHSILIVSVTSQVGDGVPVHGKLYLVDLAGSERMSKSGVSGVTMKETQYINKSLASLGDVMEALDAKSKHVPYRNSKLTYLLQDSLGGNARTMMIVTVCPTEHTNEETLFTLQFASRARNIQLAAAKKNMSVKNLEESLRSLRREVKELRRKKQLAEEHAAELKRDQKKEAEKMATLLDAKIRNANDSRMGAEAQIQILTRSNSELSARLHEAKESIANYTAELETLQRNYRKSQDSLKLLKKDKDTVDATLQLKDKENDLLRQQLKVAKEQVAAHGATSILSRHAKSISGGGGRASAVKPSKLLATSKAPTATATLSPAPPCISPKNSRVSTSNADNSDTALTSEPQEENGAVTPSKHDEGSEGAPKRVRKTPSDAETTTEETTPKRSEARQSSQHKRGVGAISQEGVDTGDLESVRSTDMSRHEDSASHKRLTVSSRAHEALMRHQERMKRKRENDASSVWK